jgi:23S rRNA (guanosine2251-2'-O)-methyltransferase
MTDVYGIHAVAAVLQRTPRRVRVVHVQRGKQDSRVQAVVQQAKAARIRVAFVDKRWLDRMTNGAHQGVAADCHELALADEAALVAAWQDMPSPRLLLVLDEVLDPRNLGACLRSAKAAGVQVVVLPKRRSAPLNAAALKTAAGAAEGLFIVEVSNLARRLAWLRDQGVWLIGAASEGAQPWTAADMTVDVALVLGGEEKGLRVLTRKYCDQLVQIPLTGEVESLNVSVAAGIMLFEAVRQRAVATT